MLRKLNEGVRIGLVGLALACAMTVASASDSDEYVAEAKQYLQKGKSKEAIIQLKNALKSDPANVDARVLLGQLYLASGDTAGARKELGRAARLGGPKDTWMAGLGHAFKMDKD